MPPVDVQALRAAHPIADVVAASGVELRPSGRAFMGRCPFHAEDHTPSMSVDGIPGRYHCFACGVGGDVIDYVARFNRTTFLDAVDRLAAGSPFTNRIPTPAPLPRPVAESPRLDRTTPARIFEINQLAWQYFTQLPYITAAERYMRDQRRIDIRAIRSATDGHPLVGYAPHTGRRLADTLQQRGVSADELIDADLAARREGRMFDTYRGRIIVPVRDPLGRIEGFLGRDITGNPRASKYRNPTLTPTFDKSRALYRPVRERLAPDGHVVVVEGFMDALAITAAAAHRNALADVAACTTSGLAVTRVQAAKVVTLSHNPVVIALDGDDAGLTGAARWIKALSDLGRDTHTIRLPDGRDPADWLAERGPSALALFQPTMPMTRDLEPDALSLPIG